MYAHIFTPHPKTSRRRCHRRVGHIFDILHTCATRAREPTRLGECVRNRIEEVICALCLTAVKQRAYISSGCSRRKYDFGVSVLWWRVCVFESVVCGA